MAWFRKRHPAVPTAIQKNIARVAEVEQELARQQTPVDRISDIITSFTGSIRFIIAHAVFFVVWVVINAAFVLGGFAFDPYPYQFLNFILAVEAVLLGTFVLMSQNRQNRRDELWLRIGLQISMLAEQESTKTLQLLQRICERLDIRDAASDKELKQLIQTTQLETLAQEMEAARKEGEPDSQPQSSKS